ncbi:MAG: hypothetical protein HY364_01720 [Candidatus Aenigmarchaeota archaeon]|nr:hypothetical protein [Candidatus Aenigmarchaeota archaeon]
MGYRLPLETPETKEDVFFYAPTGTSKSMVAFPEGYRVDYDTFLLNNAMNNFEANYFGSVPHRRFLPEIKEALIVMEKEYPGLREKMDKLKDRVDALAEERVDLIGNLYRVRTPMEEILQNEQVLELNARQNALEEVLKPALYTAYKFVQHYLPKHSIII